MKKYCLALDLKDDEKLIAEYERWHKSENGWPEVRQSLVDGRVISMEIFRTGNRLFMIMETADNFSFDHKRQIDSNNSKVKEWESLMDQFQQRLPWAPDEKWVLMNKIFEFKT